MHKMSTRVVLTLGKSAAGGCRLPACRAISSSANRQEKQHYKLVVVGGGAGGCATAAKFTSWLGKGKVAVIDPAQTHYYQPMWTLVGAGIKTLEESAKPMEKVLPKGCEWIKDKAVNFDPEAGVVTTEKGDQVSYDYLVVAMGLQLNYSKVKGLPEAFEMDPSVCSNYWDHTVTRTFPALEKLKGGNAVFTFPNTPIKCAGAPQKIMYLADDYLRKNGRRNSVNIIYNTSLPVIFGVKKYAACLMKIVEERGIHVNYRRNLIEVNPEKHEAVFEDLDSEGKKTETIEYSFLHVTPPMSAPDPVRNSPLVNKDGYVEVNKETLQHVKYPNIFSIGDCNSAPTSKTAAAAAAQCGILFNNLKRVMEGKESIKKYDGYTSCPLITSYDKCILAEFDFDGQPLETFPFDQGKERKLMYFMKAEMMPTIYWELMLSGNWNGPGFTRKLLHLGMGR